MGRWGLWWGDGGSHWEMGGSCGLVEGGGVSWGMGALMGKRKALMEDGGTGAHWEMEGSHGGTMHILNVKHNLPLWQMYTNLFYTFVD